LHGLLDCPRLQRSSSFLQVGCGKDLTRCGKLIRIFIVAQRRVGDCQRPFFCEDFA